MRGHAQEAVTLSQLAGRTRGQRVEQDPMEVHTLCAQPQPAVDYG